MTRAELAECVKWLGVCNPAFSATAERLEAWYKAFGGLDFVPFEKAVVQVRDHERLDERSNFVQTMNKYLPETLREWRDRKRVAPPRDKTMDQLAGRSEIAERSIALIRKVIAHTATDGEFTEYRDWCKTQNQWSPEADRLYHGAMRVV